MGTLISFNITPKITPIMRPTRPPQIAPNGQRFDPSASPIPPANKRPATKHATDQTEKLNFLGAVGSGGGVFIIVLGPNVTVHRAAANDVDFRTRAARGSVCNGLLSDVGVSSCPIYLGCRVIIRSAVNLGHVFAEPLQHELLRL